jgi:hypothetical protein
VKAIVASEGWECTAHTAAALADDNYFVTDFRWKACWTKGNRLP